MVLEVGPCFEDPEWLYGEERDYEDSRAPFGEEWFNLEPGDDIVYKVRDVQQSCCAAEDPAKHGFLKECKEPMSKSK